MDTTNTTILPVEISELAAAAIWAAKLRHTTKPPALPDMAAEILEEYALAWCHEYARGQEAQERLVWLWRKERDAQ